MSHVESFATPIDGIIEHDSARPLVSVMIPSYEPSHLLLKTLQAILAQDMGAERMQIAIVDDASPKTDVAALIEKMAPVGRVEIYRNQKNLGLAGNWNECIRLARGQVVHLLHQDDWVATDFYQHMLPAFEHPAVGMAFCRHAYVDLDDQVTHRTKLERWFPGVIKNWLERISEKERVQCPATLVRRSVYESLGGYRNDLIYALDWEMWVRIAVRHAVWYHPRLMAFYRRHNQNETARLAADGKTFADEVKAVKIFTEYLPAESRARLSCRAMDRLHRNQKKKAAHLSR